jgi:hypothetical protein
LGFRALGAAYCFFLPYQILNFKERQKKQCAARALAEAQNCRSVGRALGGRDKKVSDSVPISFLGCSI